MIPYDDPPGWADLTDADKARIGINGCGPGNWKLDLVPDELLGVDGSEACDRHDYEYWLGKDRKAADKRFRRNWRIACKNQHPARWPILAPLVEAYYLAVRLGGRKHFGSGA